MNEVRVNERVDLHTEIRPLLKLLKVYITYGMSWTKRWAGDWVDERNDGRLNE